MSLHARISLPARGTEVDITVERGRVLALLGPNGAGKSTTLDAIAGLLHPDSGVVDLHGRRLLDTEAGIDIPAHRRGVATLAQNPLLFPHLSVLDNVAFARRAAGDSRRRAREQAHHWLGRVDADTFADRTPARLSGGQAQRVALARALAAEPEVILLDEPMGALDVGGAPALRRTLRAVLRDGDRTAVIVTHDVLDALALADSIAVLDHGRVVETGSTREVLATPRSPFTARLVGTNLIPGIAISPQALRLADGTVVTGAAEDRAGVPCEVGAAAVALFAPEAVSVHLARPGGSERNVLACTVTAVETVTSVVRVHTATASGAEVIAAVTPAAAADLDLAPGVAVQLAVKAVQVRVVALADRTTPLTPQGSPLRPGTGP